MKLPDQWDFDERPTCEGRRRWAPPSRNNGFGLEVREVGRFYRAELFVPWFQDECPAVPANEKPSWSMGFWSYGTMEEEAIRLAEIRAVQGTLDTDHVEDRDA